MKELRVDPSWPFDLKATLRPSTLEVELEKVLEDHCADEGTGRTCKELVRYLVDYIEVAKKKHTLKPPYPPGSRKTKGSNTIQ